MKSGDFAAWLSAIAGMSSAQRAEAFATLEKASAGGADAAAESSGQGPGNRGRREDAADDKPRTLSGIVEADETFILESFKGRWSDLPRKA